MPDTQKKHLEIPLTGKLMLSDPATIGTNFQTLTNMRYTDANIQSVAGNTKINSTALATYLKVRNAHQYTKSQPSENHLLAQAYNTGLTASQVLENTTAIPSAGDFSATDKALMLANFIDCKLPAIIDALQFAEDVAVLADKYPQVTIEKRCKDCAGDFSEIQQAARKAVEALAKGEA